APLSASWRAADRELRDATEALRSASPIWRGLLTAAGRPVPLDTVRRRLVPAGGAMLLYQVGAARSFVFVIPPDGGRNGRPDERRAEAVALTVSPADARALGITPGTLTAEALAHVMGGAPAAGAASGSGPERAL